MFLAFFLVGAAILVLALYPHEEATDENCVKILNSLTPVLKEQIKSAKSSGNPKVAFEAIAVGLSKSGMELEAECVRKLKR